MSVSPVQRMAALIQLIELRKAQTDALTSDLADIITKATVDGTPVRDIAEGVCGEGKSAVELRNILSLFYARETELLVQLGVCEVVPVGSAEEASIEAAEILTRMKGQ